MPVEDRSPEQMTVQDPTTGCRGCALGIGQSRNVFENLATVEIVREKGIEELEQKRLLEEQMEEQARAANAGAGGG